MEKPEKPANHGLCECGCGEQPRLAEKTDPRFGWVKGQPKRFVNGHNRRKSPHSYEKRDGPLATQCWIWVRTLNNKGYGRSGQKLAHRVFYADRFGPIPAGKQIDHLCRNRACVNPEHLEPVNASVNQQRGSNAKLTEAQVRQIRSSPLSGRRLAEQMGLSHTAVCDARSGRRWSNVE